MSYTTTNHSGSIGIRLNRLFDWLEECWESIRAQRLIGTLLVLSFLGAIAVIEVNRWGVLPEPLTETLPTNHLIAIDLVFTLVLITEVISLVFSLAHSVSTSVGKQFEILSLILVRDTFRELSHFSEPLVWEEVSQAMVPIVSTAVGALLIFVILGFYYQAQQHRPITTDVGDRTAFVTAKKIVATLLLVGFIGINAYNINFYLQTGEESETSTFELFYTLLIFSDILIVLLSLRYSNSYHISFRNTGFAVATVFIRLALIAPVTVMAILGSWTALFALGLTMAYNRFVPMPPQQEESNFEPDQFESD